MTKEHVCQACADGDHGNCGQQSWCQCRDERDGNRDAPPDHGPACSCPPCIEALIAEDDDE